FRHILGRQRLSQRRRRRVLPGRSRQGPLESDSMQRMIYFFGDGQADGGNDVKHLVGGKGASLAEMTKAGLNVPPGFTISAECCDLFYRNGRTWPAGLEDEVRANLARLEKLTGRRFGRDPDPLLLAVRSGAAQS